VSRMVRKQVYISPEHEAALKRRARELGVTESDLIRRGIEQIAHRSLTRDERAWEEELAFIDERATQPPIAGTRDWTRDELYDRDR
jgi:hypothetical protein